jgi:hypothetical protein
MDQLSYQSAKKNNAEFWKAYFAKFRSQRGHFEEPTTPTAARAQDPSRYYVALQSSVRHTTGDTAAPRSAA